MTEILAAEWNQHNIYQSLLYFCVVSAYDQLGGIL